MPDGKIPFWMMRCNWPSLYACTEGEFSGGTGGAIFSANGTPAILAVKSVTNHAVRREVALAGADILSAGGKRVRVRAAANRDAALRSFHEFCLHVARRSNLASPKKQQRCHHARDSETAIGDGCAKRCWRHGYSTTMVMFMLPWFAPQK